MSAPPTTVATPGTSRIPGSTAASKRRANRLAEQGEIHDVGGQVFERPIQTGVSEQHRADRERQKNRQLSRRLSNTGA